MASITYPFWHRAIKYLGSHKKKAKPEEAPSPEEEEEAEGREEDDTYVINFLAFDVPTHTYVVNATNFCRR